MIINKTDAFITELNRKRLVRLQALQDQLYNDYNSALDLVENAKYYDADKDKAISRLLDIEAQFDSTADEIEAIHEHATQRYVDHFEKDADALIEDIQDIINHIVLDDFKKHLARYDRLFKQQKKQAEESDNKERVIELQNNQLRFYSDNELSMYCFLTDQVITQLHALESWGYLSNTEQGQRALGIIKSKSLGFYPAEPEPEQLSIFLAPEPPANKLPTLPADKHFLTYGNSSVTDGIFNLLAVTNMPQFLARQSSVNHGAKYKGEERDDTLTLSVKRPREEYTITVPKSSTRGRENPVSDLFLFALMKVNEQALHGGMLSRDYIEFNLRELVDKGLYANMDSARRGFRIGADGLLSIKVGAERWIGKKKKYGDKKAGVLFTSYNDPAGSGGQCQIYLSKDIDWRVVIAYWAIFPNYYFTLSRKGKALLYAIFYLARQNTDRINDQGYFTISFRALQHRLGLPDENDSKHAYKIKEGIDKAIEEVEQAHSKHENNTELQLAPVYDPEWTAREYVAQGYLRVSFTGEYKKEYIAIATKTEQREKQAAKIRERANIKALAELQKEQLRDQ